MRQTITLAAVLAVMALAAPAAMAEGSNGKFCLKGPGTAQDCKYDTLAACNKDKKTGQQCAANANTTGTGTPSGTMNSPASK